MRRSGCGALLNDSCKGLRICKHPVATSTTEAPAGVTRRSPLPAMPSSLHPAVAAATTIASTDIASAKVAAVERKAKEVAKAIFDDMYTHFTLEAQQARLGSMITSPLPLCSLNGTVDEPIFYPNRLQFAGSFQAFDAALASSVDGHHNVVAATQSSGSGTTKLALAHGAARSLMVILRVRDYAMADCTKLLFEWTGLRPRVSPDGKRRISESALAALRLATVCYVEWVTMVLEAFLTLHIAEFGSSAAEFSGDVSSALAATLRQVAQRCQYNRRCNENVRELHSALLSMALRREDFELQAGTAGASETNRVTVQVLDPAPIYARTVSVNNRLRGLLWQGAQVVVFFEGAEAMIGWAPVFMRSDDLTAGRTDAPPCDFVYGLTVLMQSLLDEQRWLQVVTGHSLDLSDRILLPEFSAVPSRVTTLHHASTITVDVMVASLRRLFGSELQLSLKALQALEIFRGRPAWFFDHFWGDLSVGSRKLWRHSTPITPVALADCISFATELAAKHITYDIARWLVARCLSEDYETDPASGPVAALLCKELYFSLKLFGGQVKISRRDVAGVAIRCGLFALDANQLPLRVCLLAEPCMQQALEQAGNDLVRSTRSGFDFVYDRIEASLRTSVPLFALIDNLVFNRPSMALAVVWHILRTTMRCGGTDSLASALGAFMPMPERNRRGTRIANAVVTATRACTPAALASLGNGIEAVAAQDVAEFAVLTRPVVDVVVFDVDADAGADVIFPTTDHRTKERSLVLLKIMPGEAALFPACLQAATPAWQYVQPAHRQALTTGDWAENWKLVHNTPTAKRVAFSGIVASSPDLFTNVIRVVLAAALFTHISFDTCRRFNRDRDMGESMPSPVVLCSTAYAPQLAFPPGLREHVQPALQEHIVVEREHLAAASIDLTVIDDAVANRERLVVHAAIADDDSDDDY